MFVSPGEMLGTCTIMVDGRVTGKSGRQQRGMCHAVRGKRHPPPPASRPRFEHAIWVLSPIDQPDGPNPSPLPREEIGTMCDITPISLFSRLSQVGVCRGHPRVSQAVSRKMRYRETMGERIWSSFHKRSPWPREYNGKLDRHPAEARLQRCLQPFPASAQAH